MKKILLLSLIFCVFLTGCNSKKTYYEKGLKSQEEKDYVSAIEYFEKAGDYEDAQKHLSECKHLDDVQNDSTAPKISGMEDGAVIELDYGQDFNLEDYMNEILVVEDEVSGVLKQYSFSISEKVMSPDSADIDTTQSGEYPVLLTASDEAGNKAELNFTLKIGRMHITKDNPYPVIYEGEFGKVTLSSIRYGTEAGVTGYYFTFDIENNASTDMVAYLANTYINNIMINSYTDMTSIESGRRGSMDSCIMDSDITSEMDGFTQIESNVCIATSTMFGNGYVVVPVIIDRDAVDGY